MSDPTKSLNTAQLAIYVILALPILYVLKHHGNPGFMGWFYLLAFCTLRIVGGALAVSKGSEDESAAIVSNIGLSPLLLALSGIIREARFYRLRGRVQSFQNVLVNFFHVFVIIGLALIAAGASAFKDPTQTGKLNLVKAGIVILLVAWLMISTWAFYSALPSEGDRDAVGFHGGNKLLYGVLISLPFVGIRALYSVIAILHPSKELNPVNGDIGLRAGLDFVPELLAALILIMTGLMTRGLKEYVETHVRRRSSRRKSKRGSTRSTRERRSYV